MKEWLQTHLAPVCDHTGSLARLFAVAHSASRSEMKDANGIDQAAHVCVYVADLRHTKSALDDTRWISQDPAATHTCSFPRSRAGSTRDRTAFLVRTKEKADRRSTVHLSSHCTGISDWRTSDFCCELWLPLFANANRVYGAPRLAHFQNRSNKNIGSRCAT